MLLFVSTALASTPVETTPCGNAQVVAVHDLWQRAPGAPKPALEVTLPRIVVADPALQAKLDALLVPERLVGDTRAQLLSDGWADTVTFNTTLDRSGVVAFTVLVEGTAAYPDRVTTSLVLDACAGVPIGVEAFSSAGKTALVGVVTAEVARRKAEADPETREMIEGAHFTEADLSGFYAMTSGIAFHVHWGLPHAMAAGGPDPLVVVPWTTAASAILPRTALARALPVASPGN